MNKKAMETLEFPRMIKELEKYCNSKEGKKKASRLRPSKNVEEANQWQEETDEALRLILKYSNPPIYGINNLKPSIEHVGKGGSMTPERLLQTSDLLRCSRELKSYLKLEEQVKKDFHHIPQWGDGIHEFPWLEEIIERSIISPEEISDNASVPLRNIRRNKENKMKAIRDKLNQITKSDSNKLQDSIITVRDGRFVVPVKSENKSAFAGIVHDKSSSGATVYIEPMAVVELNNDLRILESEEEEEIFRILQELSNKVYEFRHEILNNQRILTHLDFVFAKGKMALAMDGTKPQLNHDEYFNLKKARHPFIPKDEVVPIDIYLGKEYTTLVITGPNTGGKTVSLKTVGLLSLMAASGLHIPAGLGSQVAVFDEIYTDIGDEQSIEQSLSTFSAHMTNIVQILKNVKKNSLVLFDELGAGTDPVEGAALAMAILTGLLDREIRTIATTHYSQLKLFALQTPGVKNGAMEFNIRTLSPSFKLLIGVPGKSNAFEISRHLGLSEEIIKKAQNFTTKEDQKFEDILQKIERDQKRIDESKKNQEILERKIIAKEKELAREIEKTKNSREKIIQAAKDEAYDLLKQAKEDTKEWINELKFMKKEGENQAAAQLEQDLDKKLQEYHREEELLKTTKNKKPISIGDDVEILGLGEVGEVLTEPNNKGEVLIQVGMLKVNANIKNLKPVTSVEEERAQGKIQNIIKNKADQNIQRQLDIRGLSIEEGRMEVDKYLDNCILVGLKEVQIIHGKGTGVLRQGITDYLKGDSRVSSIRFGNHNEGGMGVTVLQLK
ncbi:MAG: endonuclease MutS2 [Tissierellia bacterium]|nr:endonuclease MutS2 [Tissierellia bacterium]